MANTSDPLHLVARLREAERELLEEVWPQGRNPAAPWDGHHFVPKGLNRPVSISRVEALILSNLVSLSQVQTIFEVGSGVGYSAVCLALGLAVTNRQGLVISLDNFTEGKAKPGDLSAIAQHLLDIVGLGPLVRFVYGTSPDDLPALLQGTHVDVAFIDGNHHGNQPLRDYRGLLPFLRGRSLLLFHDVDASRYTVPEAVSDACDSGWSVYPMTTSCYLTALYKDASWKQVLDTSYDLARNSRLAPAADQVEDWT